MTQTIEHFSKDPHKAEQVTQGMGLPFAWDPASSSLKEALKQSQDFWQREDGAMPAGFVDALNKALMALVQQDIYASSVNVGDKLPLFSLPNHKGEQVNAEALLAKGPLVLTFYRGGWCPYCNLALRALQAKLPEFKAAGAQLVAVTPQLPDGSLSTVEQAALTFDVLTDKGAGFADQLGIVWNIPDYALAWHEKYFGLFLEEHNGEGNNSQLPVPATYVIDQQGIVRWRFVDVDYWKRAEPDEVLDAVKALNA